MLRFLLFSEAAQPVEIDKKHKKNQMACNKQYFSTTTTCKQRIKIHTKFQLQQKENQFPLVFAVFSHLTSVVFIKDRPVLSFWVLRFRSRGLRFRVFGCFIFEIWVLRF